MAVLEARTQGAGRGGQPPAAPQGRVRGFWASLVDYYQGIMFELRKVTWPDWPQVRQATIAILIFVLIIALLITLMDLALNGILVKLIPSLFAGH